MSRERLLRAVTLHVKPLYLDKYHVPARHNCHVCVKVFVGVVVVVVVVVVFGVCCIRTGVFLVQGIIGKQ